MKIKIFTTGGSIDKIYSEGKRTINFSFGKSAIGEIVEERIRPSFDYDIESLL